MIELIDRDALMRKHTTSFAHDNKHNTEEELRFLLECISTAPIIDAQPVKHGKWETINPLYSNVYCSECGAAADKYLAKRYKGCPFCLCIMEGGTDDA